MTLPALTADDFLPLIPALVLSAGAILLLLTEVFLSTPKRAHQAAVALVSSVAAGYFAYRAGLAPSRPVFLGMGVVDPFSSFVTVIVCVALFLAVLLAADFLHQRQAERGEFYALMLFASAGMSLLAMSAELVTLFISLEILSISTYALTAFLRRGQRPAEAGFKYFILGAFSSAVLLYGGALLYGATGSTQLGVIGQKLPAALMTQAPLVYTALALLAAGFAFKVAAIPFHMWTPDVYEGAPTPVTALMSAGVKAAAFAALVRVFVSVSGSADPGDYKLALTLFSFLALVTMVGGNLLALPQRNVKRMLAYSSIAHAGYLLLGVASLFAAGASPSATEPFKLLEATPLGANAIVSRAAAFKGLLFYLLAYAVTAVGAFGTLSALEKREDEDKGTAWDLEHFAGLAQRRPGWAFAMATFMLSLAGMPPTVGFLGKLLVFQSALDAGLVGLAVVGILSSVAGAYYYLRVVVYMFMRPSPEGAQALIGTRMTEAALFLSTAAVVGFGVLPGPLSELLGKAAVLWGAP